MRKGLALALLALIGLSSGYPLYVDPLGTSITCSDPGNPCASLSLAYNAALSQPAVDEIRLRLGTYNDVFTMMDGIDINGGYDGNWDQVLQAPASTKIIGSGVNSEGEYATITAIDVTATISNVEIVGPDADCGGSTPCTYPDAERVGYNSYVIAVLGNTDLTLSDVIIRGGAAAHGSAENGIAGSSSGNPGSASTELGGDCIFGNGAQDYCCTWTPWKNSYCCDIETQKGGSGGTGANTGGKGGSGGRMDSNDGCGYTNDPCTGCNLVNSDGTRGYQGQNGVNGGAGGDYGPHCDDSSATDGDDGSNGNGASNNPTHGGDGTDVTDPSGFITASNWWRAASGTDGDVGIHGGGGGGGGGGGACEDGSDKNGSGGGGGGGGGWAGNGGKGGGGGGWAVGIYATENALVTIDEGCFFYAGTAGNGGDSGAGGQGRAGGARGASGGAQGGFGDAGRGGEGGVGGPGGDGGDGGAGSPGVSTAILATGSGFVRFINTTAFITNTGSSGRPGCGPNGASCPSVFSEVLDCYTDGSGSCQALASCGTACNPRQYCNWLNNTCLCEDDWTGDDCEIPLCDPPCQNGGICSIDHTCACGSTGFSGPDCTFEPCLVNGVGGDCGEHGACLTSGGNCTCEPGWGDETNGCSEPICAGFGCGESEICVAPNTCSCPTGWIGPGCSIPVCDNDCDLDNGVCNLDRVCECNEGWTGPECRTPCDNCEEESDDGGADGVTVFGVNMSRETLLTVGAGAGAFMFTVGIWGATRRTSHKKAIVPGSIKREKMKSMDAENLFAGSAAVPSTLTLPDSAVPAYGYSTAPMSAMPSTSGTSGTSAAEHSYSSYVSTHTSAGDNSAFNTTDSGFSVDNSIYDTTESAAPANFAPSRTVEPAEATTVVPPVRKSPSGRQLPAGLPPMPTRNPDLDDQPAGGKGKGRKRSTGGRKKSGSRSPNGRRNSHTRRGSNQGSRGLGAPPNRSPGKPRGGNRSPRRDTDF